MSNVDASAAGTGSLAYENSSGVGNISLPTAAGVSVNTRVYRFVEMLVLFLGVPFGMYMLHSTPYMRPITVAVLMSILVVVLLLRDPSFDRRQLWNLAGFRAELRSMLLLFLVGVVVLTGFVLLFEREKLLFLPLNRPEIWVMVMVFYPLLSVYPQELIYRTFFFHRYGCVFGTRWGLIAASALAFGYMHIIFHNPWAVILTVIGGALFAWRYERNRSLLAATVEHSLYGQFVFTIGLGYYFYSGARRMAEAVAAGG